MVWSVPAGCVRCRLLLRDGGTFGGCLAYKSCAVKGGTRERERGCAGVVKGGDTCVLLTACKHAVLLFVCSQR